MSQTSLAHSASSTQARQPPVAVSQIGASA
jgi:hypothetical protein